MTYRRLTGRRTRFGETVFGIVTAIVRLGIVPLLAVLSVRTIYQGGIILKPKGMPGMTATIGLSYFNATFLAKRKAMFNFRSPPP